MHRRVSPWSILLLIGLVACSADSGVATDSAGERAFVPGSRQESTSTSTTRRPASTNSASTSIDSTVPVDSEFVVLSITDGDTIRVVIAGESEPLRLIGINAPEQGECLSAEATQTLADLVGDGPIELESDVSERDDFGRLLRYVFVGDVFVNETLVRQGLAMARRYEPNTTRHDQLQAAQDAAQADGVGMWDPAACGATSQGSIGITRIHYDASGDDNDNLNDEWVEFVNTGQSPLYVTGWRVKDESATHRYTFPAGFHLPVDESVRLHTGCGQDSATSLYWCKTGSAVWNNSGDTVFILDPAGNVVVSHSY